MKIKEKAFLRLKNKRKFKKCKINENRRKSMNKEEVEQDN